MRAVLGFLKTTLIGGMIFLIQFRRAADTLKAMGRGSGVALAARMGQASAASARPVAPT